MCNHFIRINDKNRVIKGFSDAFEEPLPTDIFIRKSTSRHFYLENIGLNPTLTDYKFIDGKFILFPRTSNEKGVE